MQKFIIFLLLLGFLFPPALCAEEEKKKEIEPPRIGNFALPTPQGPGPLLGFGERIIKKDQAQLLAFGIVLAGPQKRLADVIPTLVYGIEDDLSICFNTPIAASYKYGGAHSSGWEDIFVQTEYSFFSDKTKSYEEQATVLASVFFPTGSAKKQPPTGLGSSSFFLGTTFNRTYTDWFAFTAYGVLLTTSSEHTKFGNSFLYQGGVGRNICSVPSEFIFAWMVEMTGLYMDKSKIRGKLDFDSGGNTVYLTPSLWFSTNHWIFQLGAGFPIVRHLNGQQRKDTYLIAANIGVTF